MHIIWTAPFESDNLGREVEGSDILTYGLKHKKIARGKEKKNEKNCLK